jgi:galactose mutarotase-like enzyme
MTHTHHILDSAHGPLDLLEDAHHGLRITVNRFGAEVISLSKRDATGVWHGFLWRDGELEPPASGWGNHATVMGFYTHRLWEQKSVYEGHPIDGGSVPHGFLRHHAFAAPVVDLASGSLTYRMEADQVPPEAYPYKVATSITYTLGQGGLSVKFSFENKEDHPVALSFGWHPGFAVASLESARLLLPEGTYIQQIAVENFLTGEVREIPFAGGEMPFPKENLIDSYLIDLNGVPARRFVLEDSVIGHRVECDYGEAPYMTIWSNGDPFLCVEPCWGLPDNNPPVPFEQKKGIQHLAAGETLVASARIIPSFLDA